jgi:hypothetical protein
MHRDDSCGVFAGTRPRCRKCHGSDSATPQYSSCSTHAPDAPGVQSDSLRAGFHDPLDSAAADWVLNQRLPQLSAFGASRHCGQVLYKHTEHVAGTLVAGQEHHEESLTYHRSLCGSNQLEIQPRH